MNYLDKLIKENPQIASGRKNYKMYKKRIQKILKLIQRFKKN